MQKSLMINFCCCFFPPQKGPARAADPTQIGRKLIFFLEVLEISSYFTAPPRVTGKNKRKDTLGNIEFPLKGELKRN